MFRLSDCLLRETDLGFPPSPLRALVTMPCGGRPVFAVLALRSNGASDFARIREKQAQPATSIYIHGELI
jgi:hypothetical protein